MGAQDNTEKVLRSLHVLLSKSELFLFRIVLCSHVS